MDRNEIKLSEGNIWSELPYYNCRIPEFNRSESTGSSTVEYGQVPVFENEDVFSVVQDGTQPDNALPSQAYSNAEVEHQLNFTSWNTPDANDDEQIVQFENTDVLEEHAAKVTRKLANTNKTTQTRSQNRKAETVPNSNNVHGRESLSVAPTYQNAEAEQALPSESIDPDYSFDDGQVIQFENQDVVDQLKVKSLNDDGSKTNVPVGSEVCCVNNPSQVEHRGKARLSLPLSSTQNCFELTM